MIEIPIVTKNLIIRRFEYNDLLPFLKFMGNSDSTKYLAFEESQKTEAGAKSLFEYVCAAYDSEQPVHSYAIADRQSNQYLGSCGFATYKEGIVECYYSVNAEYGGRRIATEATTALVALLSKKYEVRAYCHQDNHAAHAVAMNSGFHSEGMSLHENFGFQGLLFVYPKRS